MEKVTEIFGSMVFNDSVMEALLPKQTYKALQSTIKQGKRLDAELASVVANAMKDWAIEKGATHYTHWFQPMTGVTAEKHDSFITPKDGGKIIMEFSGKELMQGESDASSFPSGGLRATFEARGYTAWDATSYAFIKEKVLYIPTVFCSYGGEALDQKTALLRSMEVISKQAVRILRLFGNETVQAVRTTVGAEQEYFLVDRELWNQRKDLIYTGRTLFGCRAPKGQELDDHYFGSIKQRVQKFMTELNEELWKLGVLAKTEHNEAAPAQHELAPIFSSTNIASDHNQLTMELMQKIAKRHGMICLLHEKPFKGVNGSGKHNNWSLGTDTGVSLFAPGKDAKGNLQFVTFFVNVLAAVQRHNALLKASIASATNAHRLGANEAPPAIVSAFLGKTMTDVLHKLLEVPSDTPIEIAGKKGKSVGLVEIPEIFLDNTDRNRTSPFAFTGNRFEFRAVGSSANCAGAMTTLNAAVAEQLKIFKTEVDKELAKGKKTNVAIMDALKPIIASVIDVVCFDGNGYSEEWKEEAKRRGLDTETSVPEMIKVFTKPESIKMFTGTGVYTEKELEARNEVKWEMYTKKVQIESRVLVRMAINHIIPAVLEYKSKLLKEVALCKDVFGSTDSCTTELELIAKISGYVEDVRVKTAAMKEARKKANAIENEYEKAKAYHEIAEALFDLRKPIDKLEEIVDNKSWPLPKYREMLFIS